VSQTGIDHIIDGVTNLMNVYSAIIMVNYY